MYLKENMINIVKREQKMAETFGHYKDLITLSQVLTYNSLYIIKTRGRPRVNIRLSLHPCNRWSSESRSKLACILPSRDRGRA